MSLRNPARKPLKHRALVAAMSAALALGVAQQAAAQTFPASINLGSLNGAADGFRLDGVAAGDLLGRSVSTAGDINGDGFSDLILGAPNADSNGGSSGSSYVVFGKGAPFAATPALGSLNGANGFRLDGAAAGDLSGYSVSDAGDVNGDGIDDLIVGAYFADSNGHNSGSSYVVFGHGTPFAPTLALSSLTGVNGFRLDGASADEFSGFSVSAAGDINGDGIGDLIVGAIGANPNGYYSGSSYVVFGQSTPFAATLALGSLNGANGFRLDGAAAYDYSGRSVSAAGDINGDGLGDLIIGANYADTNGFLSGTSYVVFGKNTPFDATLAFGGLNGANGFRLDGAAAGDRSGDSVSGAGDVNGDGFDDVIIGAWGADPNGENSGSSYVVFGRSVPFLATLTLSNLNGTNGFRLDGAAASDFSGHSVSAAGDVNGDGLGDLIVGASGASPNGNQSGSSYVVFGRSTPFAATLALASLTGANGFRLDGAAAGDRSGDSVSSAGDVNGDGFNDLIVGAKRANANGNGSGSSYIVFGRNTDIIFKSGFE